MPSQTSGELPKFSVSMPEEMVTEVEAVAKVLIPRTSRNSAIRYLVSLGLAEHKRRQEETARALAVLQMARVEVPA